MKVYSIKLSYEQTPYHVAASNIREAIEKVLTFKVKMIRTDCELTEDEQTQYINFLPNKIDEVKFLVRLDAI